MKAKGVSYYSYLAPLKVTATEGKEVRAFIVYLPLLPVEGTWTCPVWGPRGSPQVEDLRCMWIKDGGKSENGKVSAAGMWAGQCLLHEDLWPGTGHPLARSRMPHSASAKTPLSGPMTHVTCSGKLSSILPSELDWVALLCSHTTQCRIGSQRASSSLFHTHLCLPLCMVSASHSFLH